MCMYVCVTVEGREIRVSGLVPWHNTRPSGMERRLPATMHGAWGIDWLVKSDMAHAASLQCSMHVFTVVCREKHAQLQCIKVLLGRHQSHMHHAWTPIY